MSTAKPTPQQQDSENFFLPNVLPAFKPETPKTNSEARGKEHQKKNRRCKEEH